MRILIVGPSVKRSKGGMATVIKDQLADELLSKRHKLSYLITHVEGSAFEKAGYSLKGFFHILFNSHKYDIVHFHTAADASFYRKSILLRLSAWLGLKTIIHIHGSDFGSFYLNSGALLKKYIANTLSISDKILVLSNYWKSFFAKEFKNVSVQVFANGVNISSFKKYIRKPTEFKNFLFLGRLGQRKGTYDLLEAINVVINKRGKTDLMFNLAGDGEIVEVKIKNDQLGLNKNVKLLGWLDEVQKREMLKIADVVVLPSYDENLPMSLIEAMACGKVIISTFTGGIPDLVKQEINGFLLVPGDVEQLVKYILYVSENPEIVRPIAAKNISTINENFNLNFLNAELSTIYDSFKKSSLAS